MRALSYIAVVLAVACSVDAFAKPYEDTRRRFRLDVPDGWSLSPQFGDTSGMVFKKQIVARRGSGLAMLIVHTDPFGATDARDAADKLESELSSQPGFKRVTERAAFVGGKPAIARELRALISKEPKLEKTIEAYFLESNAHVYMLHFESASNDFARIREDMLKILASFAPTASAPRAREEEPAIRIDAPAASIAGRWVNDDGLVMVLADDGSFALAEAQGRYEARDGTLTLIVTGQGRESFTYAHDAAAGTLTLSSPNLPAPMTYKKTQARRDPESNATLAGRWTTSTPNGPLVLNLLADSTFSMGNTRGRWAAIGDKLTLSGEGAAPIVYRYRLTGDRIALAGGDLDAEVVFQRQPDPLQ